MINSHKFSQKTSTEDGLAQLFLLLIIIGLCIGGYWLWKDYKSNVGIEDWVTSEPTAIEGKTYKSQEECERETHKKCIFQNCDYIPDGKTAEEVCGVNFHKGWIPDLSIQQSQVDKKEWKTYRNNEFKFRYPPDFIQKELESHGSSWDIEFISKQYSLNLEVRGNYNQNTGKPYSDLGEVTGMSNNNFIYIVDGQQSVSVCPRAGCENDFSAEFFSKDQASIITLYLENQDTPELTSRSVINDSKILFNNILTTFEFSE